METQHKPTRSSEFENLLISQLSPLNVMARRFVHDQEEIADLVQETLLKALRFHEKFLVGTNIRAWLFTIMRNTFINGISKASRSKKIELVLQAAHKSSHSVNAVFYNLIGQDVAQAIGSLAPVLREPISLYNAGYKYHEISTLIQRPIGTIKTRIRTARTALSKSFFLQPD